MKKDSDLLDFGTVYQNERMIDIPASYLLGLRRRGKSVPKEILDYIEDNLDVLAIEANIDEYDIYCEGLIVEDD